MQIAAQHHDLNLSSKLSSSRIPMRRLTHSTLSIRDSQTPNGSYKDREKWNQILFENANKNHLHQDNLRWQLLAGFGVFFMTSIVAIKDNRLGPDIEERHYVQLALLFIGTLWFLVLHVEGWYYRLYVAYLVDCEERMDRGEDLVPMFKYIENGRRGMKSAHPSYLAALSWVAVCNSVHVYQFAEWLNSFKKWHVGTPISWTLAYFLLMMVLLDVGIPEWLDALGASKVSNRKAS